MRGLSSVVALIFSVLFAVSVVYVITIISINNQKINATEQIIFHNLSWANDQVLRIDSAQSSAEGVVLKVTALKGPININDIYVFVNHRFIGSCEELNCLDQTGNGVLIEGETGTIEFPYNGPCDIYVTLEVHGSVSSFSRNACLWHCRRKLYVYSEGNRQGYPVRIELDSSNFDISNTDPSEIRVTDINNRILPYWIESWDYYSKGIIWFKSDLLDGNNTYYLYYCNPLAHTESNGYEVFDWFDFNDENLVAVFHFNECSGAYTKNEVSGFDAIIKGASWVNTDHGCGLYFDGVDDYVESEVIRAPQTAYTLIVELNSFETGTEQRDITGLIGSSFYSVPLNLVYYNDSLLVYYQDAYHILSAPVSSGKKVKGGVSAYYGVDANLYVDGSASSSITGEMWDRTVETNLIIGAGVRGAWRYFFGVIDEYILYYRVLSQQEMNALSEGYLDRLGGIWVVRKRMDPEPVVTIGPEETGDWNLT